MIEIRPIWKPTLPEQPALRPQVAALLSVEQRIVSASHVYLTLARTAFDEEYVDDLASLMRSAISDLIAGCEMARTGYVKQAYSLWRSWFEQSIFFLFFLEAPLHKAAWKVKAEINQDDNPQYRLMLHQLLTESGEKHPFTLVYDARFSRLTEALKISAVPKAKRPIQRAARVLTTLSQGVHGTYQPQSAPDLDGICVQLEAHCKPVLTTAEEILTTFWVLLFTDLVALPESVLIQLRQGQVSVSDLREAGVDEADQVAALAPYFALAFSSPT